MRVLRFKMEASSLYRGKPRQCQWDLPGTVAILCDAVHEWVDLDEHEEAWLCISREKPDDGDAWPGFLYPGGFGKEELHILAPLSEYDDLLIGVSVPKSWLGHVWVWVEVVA